MYQNEAVIKFLTQLVNTLKIIVLHERLGIMTKVRERCVLRMLSLFQMHHFDPESMR